ncbi:head GIN domain-containing protein [Aurantibacter sp.]|uniref:head GIN domain-containing protein n=1 Tax=Aurantibacter sp. TaxID=2807103 RepID=UPI0032647290
MKNIILFFALIIVSIATSAQEKITEDLTAFTQVKAFDQITVTIIKSDKNQLILTGDDIGDVNIDNKKGLLKIKMDIENHMDGEDIEATLYYAEELTLLDANENAKIFSKGTFKSKDAKLAVQEGADIVMDVAIDNLYVKSTSGSKVTLTGKATTQEVVANAGGKVYNKDLSTVDTKVTVNAGGSAEIKASGEVEAKVRAGGYIAVYGNPKEVSKDKVFGGKIEVIK